MNIEQFAHSDERLVREYDYADGALLAVDFGSVSSEATAEVVDGTVIVVIGEEQHEFELPAAMTDAQAFIRNGVLTIELEDTV